MTGNEPQRLDYAPPPRMSRRLRARGRWLVLACYVGLALLVALQVFIRGWDFDDPKPSLMILLGFGVMLWELYDWAGEATGRW